MRPDGHDGAGWWRRAVTRSRGWARRPFSGRLEGVSGNLRDVGALWIDDLRSPRGEGYGKPVRGRECWRHRTVTVPAWSLLAAREAAAKSPGCLPAMSGSPSFRALPGEALQGWLWTRYWS